MAKLSYGVETLPKISIVWVGCTNVTDRRQTTDDRETTDGRTMTYSEHDDELEFTFAKKLNSLQIPRNFRENLRNSREFPPEIQYITIPEREFHPVGLNWVTGQHKRDTPVRQCPVLWHWATDSFSFQSPFSSWTRNGHVVISGLTSDQSLTQY